MSWNVVSKNNSNISGTTNNKTKLTGDENTLDVKAKKDLWIAGNDNDGKVRLQGDARLAVTGSYNDLNSVDASSATNGSVLLNGSNNRVRSYTGSNSNNNVSLRGSNNRLDSAVFGNGADRLTSINGTIGSANMGRGNDFVGIKDAQDKFTLNGGTGTDKLWLDKIDDNVDGSSAINFEQLYLKEFNSDYQVKKGTDGRYYVENNGNKLTLGTNDIDIWDGTKYTKASVLAGATGSTGSTGGTGSTGATGALPATTNNADTIELEAKDYANGTLDLKAGDDRLHVTDGAHNFNAKGGIGTDDQVQFEKAVDDYDNISFANGKFTFNDANGKTFTVDDTFEKFKFNNEMLTLQQLKDHITPFATTANADTLDLAGAASKYKKNVTFLGGDDIANLKANATGYTLDGGDGTADKLNLADFTFANLKAQTTWSGSGNGVSGLNINGNAISNFEQFDATGLTNTAGTAGSAFASLQAFIAWLTA